MKSFDEWWKTEGLNTFDYPKEAAESGFEAGQQSKQAEVDELRKNFNNALKTIEIQQRFLDDADGANNILTSQVSELQKKYDAMYNAFVVADDCRKEWHRCYVGIRQREDELRKRIDDLSNYISSDDFIDIRVDYHSQVKDLIKILKGDQS